VWLDIDHMDRHRTLTFDPERFADPRALVAALRELDLATVAIVDPGVAVAEGYELYESGRAAEHFVLDAASNPARGRVWPGVCAFPDYTREATRSWWAGEVERFASIGLAGLWCDMNEPSVFRTPSKTLPLDARHRGLGGGTHARFHNVYGQLMAEATRAGLARALGGDAPFVLTRASHLGGARFAATWTGDNQATWADLRAAIPMVLSLGLCGQPFCGPDLGGFDGDPSPELFARWFDLGAYLPFARGHSERTACRKEPWAFGAEIERCVRAALERRMRLAPLWLELARESARTGLPIVRPIFFADPGDPALRAIDDEFLLGDDLLVAPIVVEGARERELYLPRTPGGGWYEFPDGRDLIPPGLVRARAALGETPVYARAGALVLTSAGGATMRYALAAARTVHVFAELDPVRSRALERAAAARAEAERAEVVWHRPRG
jgi:alpha-glucosidase